MCSRGLDLPEDLYKKEKKSRLITEGLKKVARLENIHKVTQRFDVKRNLDNEMIKIKLLETSGVARAIMYNKQNMSEH